MWAPRWRSTCAGWRAWWFSGFPVRVGDGTAASKRDAVLISTMGGVALLSAVVALIGANSTALTILVLAMVALWATASVHHLSMSRTGELVS